MTRSKRHIRSKKRIPAPPPESNFIAIHQQLRCALGIKPALSRHRKTLPSPPIQSNPTSQTIATQPCTISPPLLADLDRALAHAFAPSTTSTYTYTVKKFLLFCDLEKIPFHLRWPADEFILCAFAASYLGQISGSTVKGYLAGIRASHIRHGMLWQGGARLHYVVNGISNLAPSHSRCPIRPPVNRAMMRMLYDHLNFTSTFDIAVFATASIAFWGQCRLWELLTDSKSNIITNPLPTLNHLAFHSTSCNLTLPWTKTTKKKGATVVLTHQQPPLSPIFALQLHIASSKLDGLTSLCSYRSHDHIIPLTRSAFLSRYNTVWHSQGLPRFTGHSFRIGGTTELLLAGVHPDVVRALGRWSSDAFLVYWRSLSDLAHLHIANLPSR